MYEDMIDRFILVWVFILTIRPQAVVMIWQIVSLDRGILVKESKKSGLPKWVFMINFRGLAR